MSTIERREPNGISVLVSGAGIGGLMAALECWRIGCNVRVFERSKTNVTSGDSFTIGPSALDTFKHWPDMEKQCYEIAYYPLLSQFNLKGEKIAGPVEMSKFIHSHKVPNRIARHMRPDFHAVLLEQLKAIGIYLEYGKEVVDYFENAQGGQAGVVLEDGSKHSTDLVIAADGVRSPSWGLVAGQPVANRSSGNAIFRVAYPVEHALTDPMIAEHFQLTDDGRSVMEMWAGPGAYAMFWRNKDFMT